MAALEAVLAGLGLLGQGVQTITDPSLNEALSPASGLVVSPYYFQSIEQEGRWKHELWGFTKERDLVPPEFGMPQGAGNPGTSYPPNPAPAIYTRLNRWKSFQTSPTGDIGGNGPSLITRRESLLRVSIGQLRDSSGAVATALRAAQIVQPDLVDLLNASILAAGNFTVGAAWLVSQTEILAGYAGLFSAVGFGSAFGHRAKVDIGGVSLGNYIPTAQLIGMSGYLNPVGDIFVEFRCAVVIAAGFVNPDVIPVYGTWWTRDRNRESEMTLDTNNTTWVINMNDPLSPPR